MTFQSVPDGANIEIDGKFAGNTPSLLQLKVGDHKITVQRSGYGSWERTISVLAGGNILVLAELTPISKSPPPIVENTIPPAAGAASPITIKGRLGSAGIELVWISPGSFEIGSLGGENDELPIRSVSIREGFWIGKHEVTQSQYERVMGENPSHFKGCENCPVEHVSWADAVQFMFKLNSLNDGFVYSLPTEGEWEYVARALTAGPFAGPVDEMAWHVYNSGGKTHPVGQKKPNAFGLYDMHGNVWEWCEDVYRPYPGAADPAPREASNELRVKRGGSWSHQPYFARSSYRGRNPPTVRDHVTGFRVVARPR